MTNGKRSPASLLLVRHSSHLLAFTVSFAIRYSGFAVYRVTETEGTY